MLRAFVLVHILLLEHYTHMCTLYRIHVISCQRLNVTGSQREAGRARLAVSSHDCWRQQRQRRVATRQQPVVTRPERGWRWIKTLLLHDCILWKFLLMIWCVFVGVHVGLLYSKAYTPDSCTWDTCTCVKKVCVWRRDWSRVACCWRRRRPGVGDVESGAGREANGRKQVQLWCKFAFLVFTFLFFADTLLTCCWREHTTSFLVVLLADLFVCLFFSLDLREEVRSWDITPHFDVTQVPGAAAEALPLLVVRHTLARSLGLFLHVKARVQ